MGIHVNVLTSKALKYFLGLTCLELFLSSGVPHIFVCLNVFNITVGFDTVKINRNSARSVPLIELLCSAKL